LLALTGGGPWRVGKRLFCGTAAHEVLWLDSPVRLFAWLRGQAQVAWAGGADLVSRAEFFAHLQMTAQNYEGVELVPHFPPRPELCYVHPPLPEGDGTCLEQLLGRFCPATP